MTMKKKRCYCLIAATLAAAFFCSGLNAANDDAKDIGIIKQRMITKLLGKKPDEARVEKLLESMKVDGSWASIDYKDKTRARWKTRRHLTNLQLMVKCCFHPDSSLRGDPKLKKASLKALNYWLAKDFKNPNWWWNMIGVPMNLQGPLLLLDKDITGVRRKKAVEIMARAKIGPRGSGANLTWIANLTAVRGVFERKADVIAVAYKRLVDEIYITKKTGKIVEGIKADFSFHQHGRLLYSHGYGAAYLNDCCHTATVVAGTQFAFSPEKIKILTSLALDGSQWMTHNNAGDFGAIGRNIVRGGGPQSCRYLKSVAQYLLKLPTDRAEELKTMSKRVSGAKTSPLVGNKHFWCSDIMVHHREAYYISARMFSTRTLSTDAPCNGEGLKGHHLSDGCNCLFVTGNELGQYLRIAPVWEWQKIPGTTAAQKPKLKGKPHRMGKRDFCGGVSDGMYGAAAFELENADLFARKAWFFFDSQYVCLGNSITGKKAYTVLTDINQCRLQGDVLVCDKTGAKVIKKGTRKLKDVKWIRHGGVGYIFPTKQNVYLRNDVQKGNWHSINYNRSKKEVRLDIFNLWIDHGKTPKNATYAYIVAPGADRSQLDSYAKDSPITVLSNNASLQAVQHKKLKMTQAVFYKP